LRARRRRARPGHRRLDRERLALYPRVVSDALSASWLSTKWGIDTVKINAMRRAGELVAVRPAQSQDWLYPAWQFGPDGQVREDLAPIPAPAREPGTRPRPLSELLDRRRRPT